MAAGPWARFEHDVAEWIQSFAAPGLEFCAGRKRIPGFPSDGFRADALLTNGHNLLAVEVEVRQTHPDTNVGKYWLLSRYQKYESVVLFHIYTPAFDSYGWRMKLGQFYAERMAAEMPFEYVLIDVRDRKDVDTTLREVRSIVGPRIKAMFDRSGT